MSNLDIWKKEYTERKNLPSTKSSHASRALMEFFVSGIEISKTSALDIGSGNGRNSIYLAQYGFEKVVGLEFVSEAIEYSLDNAFEAGVSDKVEFVEHNLQNPIPFLQDDSFDLIIDMMTMHALSKEARETYVKEVVRLLKPNGYFVFYTIAAESPEAQRLIEADRGEEPNSYRFLVEEDEVTEKAFTQEELIQMFSPLQVIKLDPVEEDTKAFGGTYKRVYYSGIFRK